MRIRTICRRRPILLSSPLDIVCSAQNAEKLQHQLLIHRCGVPHTLSKEALQLGAIPVNHLRIRR